MKINDRLNIDENINVLYVEDQIDVQREFGEILSFYVDEIFLASNGQEGLQLFQEKLPDIIITDINMPIMNGLDMIKKIRELDKDIPIIVTSAYEDSSFLLEAIKLGVEHYLLKPVLLKDIENRIATVKKRVIDKRELEAYHLYLENRVEEEIALREAEEALLIEQKKSSEVGKMVSVIAHQWKQPLHYLNLLIEDLGMEYDYQPLSQEYVKDFIQKGTDRIKFLSDTMNNFLSFYKNEAQSKSLSIGHIMQETAVFLDMSYKSLGIQINIDLKEDFLIYGIKNEIQQVVLNLMNNAKEAFDGQRRDDAKIDITILKEQDKGILIIQDNAGGIDEKYLPSIFKLDFTTKEDGNGIGLYLVKKIIEEKFNGTIDISNQDNGAQFILRFDVTKE